MWTPLSLALSVLSAVLLGCPSGDSSRIVVLPMDGSHWLNMELILRQLHARGHEITLLRPTESRYIPENSTVYTSINIRTLKYKEDYNSILTCVMECRKKSQFVSPFCQKYILTKLLSKFHRMIADSTAFLLDDPVFMKKMHDSQFDLMLTDPGLPIGAILGSYLKLPMVFNVRWINNRRQPFHDGAFTIFLHSTDGFRTYRQDGLHGQSEKCLVPDIQPNRDAVCHLPSIFQSYRAALPSWFQLVDFGALSGHLVGKIRFRLRVSASDNAQRGLYRWVPVPRTLSAFG
ncbi:hypothetical protein NL108_014159 [Boleophthalmus pectinirostris]|nr:hypothetical protein NL108_014159 [Boleophthalmus pectinirostris]